jgi:sugar transferase EpsL
MNSDLRSRLKRILDVIAASVCLVLLCPVIALIALSIRARIGRPVFFRQKRAGYRGKAFTVFKFRTMIDAYDPQGRPMSDKARITSLGRLLRKTSLDELPQLINVLTGEMSLVGPRPLLHEYLKFYTPQQARRHEVRPGITGLAQIKGRNNLSWDERFALDVWYVDHQDLLLDLRILLQTVVSLLRRNSVSKDGDLDVPSFIGSASADYPQRGLHNMSSGLSERQRPSTGIGSCES